MILLPDILQAALLDLFDKFGSSSQNCTTTTTTPPNQSYNHHRDRTWCTWTSHTHLYALTTSKSTTHWLPSHTIIPNRHFLCIFFFALIALYVLPVISVPRTTRQKQILAAPLLLTLLLLPLLYTCPYQLIHVALTVTSAGVSTRMIDLYFVQPWTGVPSRYYLRFLHASTCRSKKADSGGHKKKQASARREEQFKDLKHYERMPLMWDMKRLQIELWSPVRIFSEQQQQQQQTLANANKRRLWTFGQLACYCLVYSLLLDIIIFALSSFTVDEVMRLPLFQYGLFVGGSAAFIIYFVLQVYYTVATVWSYATGNMADPREWTMLNNYLPCFAASPADFWNNWQTLFRYLWVDLGYLPVQRWCRHFLNGDRRVVPRQAAYVAYECLPLMAVFTLSGLFHAYVVHALWRENGWSQIVFFWIHGVAVLLTKALERTLPGQKIRNQYQQGPAMAQWSLHILGMVLTWMFHVLTVPLFITPYLNNDIWIDVKERSVIWWLHRK